MNLLSKTYLPLTALALLGLTAATPAQAQVGLFNFASDAGQKTTFSSASGGITATFSSPTDPGGFAVIANPPPGSLLLSGNILLDGFPTTTGHNTPLTITFDKNLSSLILDFAVASAFQTAPQTCTLQAFENGVSVGTLTVPGVVPAGGLDAEGVAGFFGPSVFNAVQISSATAPAFAIDNIGVVAAPAVPEASTTVSFGLLLALGMGGVMVAKRKKAA